MPDVRKAQPGTGADGVLGVCRIYMQVLRGGDPEGKHGQDPGCDRAYGTGRMIIRNGGRE